MLRYSLGRYYHGIKDHGLLEEKIKERAWPFCPIHIHIADSLQFLTKKYMPKNVVWGYKGERGSSAFVLGEYGEDSFFSAHDGKKLTRNVEANVLEGLLFVLPANNGRGLFYTYLLSPENALEIYPSNLVQMKTAIKSCVLFQAIVKPKRIDPKLVDHLLTDTLHL